MVYQQADYEPIKRFIWHNEFVLWYKLTITVFKVP